MSTDAEALLKAIGAGRMQAMEAFYRCFERPVYRFALSRLSDPFDAAEVLNDVMLEVWRHADRFEGRSTVSTWILGIARHKILDRHRTRKARQTEELPEDLEDDTPSTEAIMNEAQEAAQMRRCVDKLGPNHREVVHLAFYEDMGYDDIAALMDCPAGTVKSRMHHAKEALKKCLSRMMKTA
jgi:RNA polymerase sigma-70 factor (ECF subfamily)